MKGGDGKIQKSIIVMKIVITNFLCTYLLLCKMCIFVVSYCHISCSYNDSPLLRNALTFAVKLKLLYKKISSSVNYLLIVFGLRARLRTQVRGQQPTLAGIATVP